MLAPAEADGFLVAYNYMPNIDTPENKAFKERLAKRFGGGQANLSEPAVSTYQGFKLWAEGVKKAGSVDREKVIAALESGISINGPSGKVTLDAETHHCVLNVSIAEVRNKQLDILETFQQQPPIDTSAVCNLRKNPKDNQQYVIKA